MDEIDRLADAARRAFFAEPNDTAVGSWDNVYPGTKRAWRAAARALVTEASDHYPFGLIGVGTTWHEAQKALRSMVETQPLLAARTNEEGPM